MTAKIAIPWSTTHAGYTRPLCSAFLKSLDCHVIKADEDPEGSKSPGGTSDAYAGGSESFVYVNPASSAEGLLAEAKQLQATLDKVPRQGQANPLLATVLNPGDAYPQIRYLRDLARQAAGQADALLLPGGSDIEPWLYGQKALATTDNITDHRRSILEMHLLQVATTRGLPVLAICRGSQMLNVFWGGQLIQQLENHFVEETAMQIEIVSQEPSSGLRKASILQGLTRASTFSAASFHHQATDPQNLGGLGAAAGFNMLEVTAKTGEVVKAFETRYGAPVMAFQVHPEFWAHDNYMVGNQSKPPTPVDKPITINQMMLSEVNKKVFDVFKECAQAKASKSLINAQILAGAGLPLKK